MAAATGYGGVDAGNVVAVIGITNPVVDLIGSADLDPFCQIVGDVRAAAAACEIRHGDGDLGGVEKAADAAF